MFVLYIRYHLINGSRRSNYVYCLAVVVYTPLVAEVKNKVSKKKFNKF